MSATRASSNVCDKCHAHYSGNYLKWVNIFGYQFCSTCGGQPIEFIWVGGHWALYPQAECTFTRATVA